MFNWVTALLGVIWSIALGMFWYSPKVFFKKWQYAQGITDEMMQEGNPGKSMILGVIANAISVIAFCFVLGFLNLDGWLKICGFSLLVSIGIITASDINNGAFRMTKPVVFLIDGGYRAIMYIGIGVIYSFLN